MRERERERESAREFDRALLVQPLGHDQCDDQALWRALDQRRHLHEIVQLVGGFGFRVSGLGFQVSGLGSRVSGLGFRVSVFRFYFSGFGFRVSGFELRVFGLGSRVSDVGMQVRTSTPSWRRM